MGVHKRPQTVERRPRGASSLCVVTAFLLTMFASDATAATPPLELVQKSMAKSRSEVGRVHLNLRVTQPATTKGAKLQEWKLAGVYTMGDVPGRLSDTSDIALQLLWIATLSADPVAELGRLGGEVDSTRSTVGIQEDFVYVYGGLPAVSVYRNLRDLAGLSFVRDKRKWVVRVSYARERLSGVMITRDGHTVLTATAELPLSP